MVRLLKRHFSGSRGRVIRTVLTSLLLVFVSVVAWYTLRLIRVTGLTPTATLRLAFRGGAPLTSTDGRTNVLLLGIPGGNYAGRDLTDTMLVFSFSQSQQSLAMISVPRDIWSDTLKDKVNSAYHYGEQKKDGGGLLLTKVIVEDMIGLPIHYSLLIDFSGFTRVIDTVGGVTVNVPTAFTDPEFPIPGKEEDECGGDPTFACRYEVLRFEAGTQVMDGEQSLKYVRSRHAEGDEGSDFARSRRQQEVFLALKETLRSPSVWLSPRRVSRLAQLFSQTTETDMSVAELLTVAKLFTRVPKDSIQRISLEELLYTPPVSWYGKYVLIPAESFEAIHRYVVEQLR